MSEPINNHAAERAVLGSVMQMPQVLDDLSDLSGADFYHPRHEAIWDAICAVWSRGQRPDVVIVAKQLGEELHRIGGPVYLNELVEPEVSPIPSQAPHYARAVIDAALGRRLVEASVKIRERAERGDDAHVAAEDCRRLIDEATASSGSGEDKGLSARDLVSEAIELLDSEDEPGVSTGWGDLDEVVGGLRPGQLAIVGARPSVGKSVIATNITAAACSAGIGVHFASLEMTRTEVMQRIFSASATVELSKIMGRNLTAVDWERISAKTADINNWPLWVDHTPSQSLLTLRARARTTARRFPLRLIVVDYLQLMAPRQRSVPREQQVGELSEGLKGLAKELSVPILALAQVNRGPQDRQDKRPVMSDLRESGRIEADADHVWLLHREDLVQRESTTGRLEFIVAKNRNGPTGRVIEMLFQGQYARAVPVARQWSPSEGAAA